MRYIYIPNLLIHIMIILSYIPYCIIPTVTPGTGIYIRWSGIRFHARMLDAAAPSALTPSAGSSLIGVLIIGELRGRHQELCALSQGTRGLELYIATYDDDELMSRLIASNRRLHLLLMNRTQTESQAHGIGNAVQWLALDLLLSRFRSQLAKHQYLLKLRSDLAITGQIQPALFRHVIDGTIYARSDWSWYSTARTFLSCFPHSFGQQMMRNFFGHMSTFFRVNLSNVVASNPLALQRCDNRLPECRASAAPNSSSRARNGIDLVSLVWPCDAVANGGKWASLGKVSLESAKVDRFLESLRALWSQGDSLQGHGKLCNQGEGHLALGKWEAIWRFSPEKFFALQVINCAIVDTYQLPVVHGLPRSDTQYKGWKASYSHAKEDRHNGGRRPTFNTSLERALTDRVRECSYS